MFKFTLHTDEHTGFKLITSADTPEQTLIIKELTEKLIEKITKIKVTIGYEGDE